MKKIGTKILLMMVTIIASILVLLFLINKYTFDKEFDVLRTNLENVAVEAVQAVNTDAFLSAIEQNTMDSPEYAEVQQALIDFKSSRDITYVYTMIPGNDEVVHFAIDGTKEDAAELGEEYELLVEISGAFNGDITSSSVPETDEWGTFISAYAPIKDSSGKVIGIVGVDKEVKMFVDIENHLTHSILLMSGIILVLALVFLILFSWGISKNVNQIRHTLSRISEGDLTTELNIKTRDEFNDIANAVKVLKTKFSESIYKVKDSSRTVAEYSENLSALSQQMAAAAKEVSLSIDTVAKSTGLQTEEVENINKAITSFSDRLENVTGTIVDINERISSINDMSKVSNRDLEILENSLVEIINAFNNVANTLSSFNRQLSEIFEITNFINTIADQTNLISLNASIEAARAGESGRGFTVVANEIRNLAEQSKSSSQNINTLLGNISAESGQLTRLAAEMNDRLDKQVKTISKSMESFKKIISNIEEVSPEFGKISENIRLIDDEKNGIIKSIESVAQKSEEISAASQEISASSEQSSHSTEEVADAAQKLIEKSQGMVDSVKYFTI